MIAGTLRYMDHITLTSIQAPNQDRVAAALAQYLTAKLGLTCEFVQDPPWQERERMLDAGQVDMAWICGLPYVHKIDEAGVRIELLVAPVMRGTRYQDKPIYFSDVIVRSDNRLSTFEDLRGKRWAYNEPNSHSGYNLTRFMLARLGEFDGYFGKVVEAGSHQAALEMLLDGDIDGTALDSTVLEIELEHGPEIGEGIRTIATWGPSPIPAWVIQKSIPVKLKEQIRRSLTEMDSDENGKEVLASLEIKRFARVSDQDYDPIREMARKASRVNL